MAPRVNPGNPLGARVPFKNLCLKKTRRRAISPLPVSTVDISCDLAPVPVSVPPSRLRSSVLTGEREKQASGRARNWSREQAGGPRIRCRSGGAGEESASRLIWVSTGLLRAIICVAVSFGFPVGCGGVEPRKVRSWEVLTSIHSFVWSGGFGLGILSNSFFCFVRRTWPQSASLPRPV